MMEENNDIFLAGGDGLVKVVHKICVGLSI